MLKPFTSDYMQYVLDFNVMSSLIEQQITTNNLIDNPELLDNSADILVSLVQANHKVAEVSSQLILNLPKEIEYMSVIKKGTTFGVINGGKA